MSAFILPTRRMGSRRSSVFLQSNEATFNKPTYRTVCQDSASRLRKMGWLTTTEGVSRRVFKSWATFTDKVGQIMKGKAT